MGDGFYLDAPEVLSSLHDEIEGMVGAIGLGHHETESDRFVQKGHFAKVAVLAAYEPALPGCFPGRALLGRWNASA